MQSRIVGILMLSFIASCGDSTISPTEGDVDVVGSWEVSFVNGASPFSTMVYTFSNSGNLTIALPLLDLTTSTTYSISDDELTINRYVNEGGTVPTQRYEVRIDGNTLSLTGISGAATILLTRV